MFIWIGLDGKVKSFSFGSMKKQRERFVMILSYVKRHIARARSFEQDADDYETQYRAQKKTAADAIRAEYAEMGGRC